MFDILFGFQRDANEKVGAAMQCTYVCFRDYLTGQCFYVYVGVPVDEQ